jgi:hypothetical protein
LVRAIGGPRFSSLRLRLRCSVGATNLGEKKANVKEKLSACAVIPLVS